MPFQLRNSGASWARFVAVFVMLTLLVFGNEVTAAPRVPSDAPRISAADVTLPALPRQFETVSRGWLHISYPASLNHWVEPLFEEGTAFKELALTRLGQDALQEVHVRLAMTPGQMAQLAPLNTRYPKYAVGVAYSDLGLVLLTRDGVHPNSQHDLREVFRHELAHIALHEATGGRHVPLWFNEGLAVVLSGENQFARTKALWTATLAGRLLELKALNRSFPNDIVGVPLAYAQSADIVRFLGRNEQSTRFVQLISRIRKGQAFDSALLDAFGMDAFNLEAAWKQDVENRYSFWPIVLSGGFVWAFAIGLAVVAWGRKRKRQRVVLARWAREEAAEDAGFRAETFRKLVMPWVAIQSSQSATASGRPPPPKVEHEGSWHTLH